MPLELSSYLQDRAGIIIFDGSCGACSTFIGEKRAFFEKHGFTVVPLQEEWIRDLTGLSPEALLESIHLYTAEGEILRGVDSLRFIASKIWWLAPISLLLRVRFLRPFFQNFYNLIARRRRKISRVCGLQSRAIFKDTSGPTHRT